MARYRVRVDSSFYGDRAVRNESVIGVAFEVTNLSNGREDHVFDTTWGDILVLRDATEAELYGIYRAVTKSVELTTAENVVVLDVVCDSDTAIESLQERDVGYEIGNDVLDVVEPLYSVNWKAVDRSKMWDIDDAATRTQRRVRDDSGFEL